MFKFNQLVALALVASSTVLATPATKRADAGLVVSVTSNDASVSSVEDLILTAKVENTGSEDVKVLKFGTVLDDTHPTRSFRVTKGEEEVAFTGVKLQVDLEKTDDSAYTIIPAGSSVEVKHTVASIFDFATAGTGAFDFAPAVNFRSVAAGEGFADVDSLVPVDVADASSVSVEITSDVAKRHMLPQRAVVRCDDTSAASFIQASYDEAKELASVASSYASSGGPLFDSYFKTNSQSTISGVFDKVVAENDSSRGLYCTDPYDVCTGGVIAYMLIATTEIYYCDIFFDEVSHEELCSGGTTVNARNNRGGTTLHELTHAVDGTDDINYGCPANQQLSAGQQRINADNYNCFATAVFAEQC